MLKYKRFAFFPIHIGDYVVIEDDCIINAATIGSFVHIGKGAIVVFTSVFILKLYTSTAILFR